MALKGFTLLILTLLFLAHQAAAQEVAYDITVTLSEDHAHEVIRIGLNNTGDVPLENFSYELPADAREIRVYDAGGNLSPQVSFGANVRINSKFRAPILPGETDVITIEFDTAQLISRSGDEYVFSALFSPPVNHTKTFLLRVDLPTGMGLSHPVSSGALTDIAPLPDETLSDGTTTRFVWDVSPKGDFAVFIRYMPLIKSSVPPDDKAAVNGVEKYSNHLISALAFFIVLLAGFYLLRKKEKKVPGKTEFMRDDERLVIGIVSENDGIVQKRLVEQTGFSKAKISKIVSELEKRGIVRVEKIGRRNKLFLSEEFKKR